LRKNNIAPLLRWLPGIIISVIVIFFITRVVAFDQLVRSVGQFGLINILVISGITLLSLAARAVVWMSLIPGLKFPKAFLLINESYLFNNIIPRSGEIIKIFQFSKSASEPAMKVFSRVIVERALDLIIAALLVLSTIPFITQLQTVQIAAKFLLILLIILFVAIFIIAFNAEKTKMWLGSLSTSGSIYRQKILPRIEMTIDGFKILTNLGQFLSIILWILVTWFLWTVVLFYGIFSIYPEARFWWAMFTEGVLALGIALPSAPAGLGVFEGSMIVALSVFDINTENALGISIIIHIIQIVLTSLIGVIAVVTQGDTFSEIIGRIISSRRRNLVVI